MRIQENNAKGCTIRRLQEGMVGFSPITPPGEAKEQKGASNAKRPEPEGREEPRPGSGSGRVWKKPLGVKPQQGKVSQLFMWKVRD